MVSGEHPTRGSRYGGVERQLTRAALRILAGARVAVALVGGLLGVMSAPDAGRTLTVVGVAVVLAWSLLYARWLWLGPPSWLVWADAVVLAAAGLSQPWTVPVVAVVNGQGWVIALVSVSAVIYQWHTKPVSGLVATLIVTVAFLLGGWWTAPDQWAGAAAIAAWTPVQGILSRLLAAMLLRGARTADAQQARAEAARREAAVAEAVRADERAHTAMLHDTAATTLLMVGLGEVASNGTWLREQAERDLAALEGNAANTSEYGDVMPGLLDILRAGQVKVELSAPDVVALPRSVATALHGALREALNNVARHSGTMAATVTVTDENGRVAVAIADRGKGFLPGAVPQLRRGVANSIVDRLAAAGGRAEITSAPGAGTTVRLEWDRG